ncbi:extracellular elastinolytic metallo proteinase [Cylindrobasidium torrendii FP15055 ss-10]|uniref:Extracellular metalloproteinase n=1 Tax=Cylindrobasidium torrendii FP15055 ss-10 TaxID=1314674 RepID=A0A0D7BN91_9AGAR|nr:extracellular elastinolytic metallo proteinase [Cylindrobasidium torrendii FP15055 ss-10]
MRFAILASFVALAVAHAHDSTAPRRKSLGFGPVHPQAEYRSSPYQITTNGFVPQEVGSDPFAVARLFIEDQLVGQLSESLSYRIRDDSYTDSNTGITHIYARQLVNGFEVADGNMNINVKDGLIISYGNSFYKGLTSEVLANSHKHHPHREYCSQLEAEMGDRNAELRVDSTEQTVMGSRPGVHHELRTLRQLHASNNCEGKDIPYQFHDDSLVASEAGDVRAALLQFMLAATPNDKVQGDILSNYDHYLEKMSLTPEHHFVSTGEPIVMKVDNVPDTVNPVRASLVYVQVPNEAGDATELHLVWKMHVEMQDNWYEAAVSAQSPHRIISVVDWASDAPVPTPEPSAPATYRVFPWGVNDPTEGERKHVKENFDALASPAGWHSIPAANDPSLKGTQSSGWKNSTTTWGNNVFAQENWEGQNSYITNYRPEGDSGLYDYPYNPKETSRDEGQAEAEKYINATVTQLFYTTNMVHDLYHRYGFDEVSGNFQQYNFGRGGRENDGVICNAQDGSGYNNANFMTPPDGQNGRMRMYLWNTALPFRDGDLEAGIVIHEYSHGLSTRLTGGPSDSGCLGWGESGGMGEGWGDFLATTIRANKTYSDYAMGSWAANTEKGIRNYPYSLDESINPSSYQTLDKPGYWGVHAIGEVWAQLLWVVSQRLIEKHGFSDTLYPPLPLENGTIPEGDFYRPRVGKKPLIPKHGNTLMVQLVLNGMKLQPCRPSFFDARDAIIQADEQLTGGENFCELWKGFASRGLGQDAAVIGRTPWGGGQRSNGYSMPTACVTME